MSVIYADQARGGRAGVNVGIYGSPMECLGYRKINQVEKHKYKGLPMGG